MPFSCMAIMACWMISGVRPCMRLANAKVPGVLSAACVLLDVSVTRQNE